MKRRGFIQLLAACAVAPLLPRLAPSQSRKFADGGFVGPEMYFVGESGPELFKPSSLEQKQPRFIIDYATLSDEEVAVLDAHYASSTRRILS